MWNTDCWIWVSAGFTFHFSLYVSDLDEILSRSASSCVCRYKKDIGRIGEAAGWRVFRAQLFFFPFPDVICHEFLCVERLFASVLSLSAIHRMRGFDISFKLQLFNCAYSGQRFS